MNLKKMLWTALVSAVCCFANTAAAQKDIYIPEDYEAQEADADFKADGPLLLFSDSPEMVYNKGILYRDTAAGDVRLFFHHVNAVPGEKKLAVIIKNVRSLRPIGYKILRSGVDGLTYNYLRDGKEAQKKYFSEKQMQAQGRIGFSKSAELRSGRGVILKQDQLLTGMLDIHLDAPAEISVLLCEPRTDLEIFNESAGVLPQDEHPLRGTFAASNWSYTLRTPLQAPMQPVLLKLAGTDTGSGYAKGVDATTGLAAENYGNYGVLYRVNFAVQGDEPVSFILNPIGGEFAGYAVLENRTKNTSELLALPAARLELGDTITEAIELAQLKAGEYSFIWSPPGASNLPVRLLWRNAR